MKLPPPPPVDATKFCQFVTASPTPFHVVANLATRLISAGFKRVSERAPIASELTGGGKYFYTRNQSTLVAFTLPSNPTPSTAISFAAGHTDSPCLKVRPNSKREKEGYIQVGVETYGGGIWHTWFDRDLSVAGRVIVSGPEGKYISKLVKVDRPILRIPSLPIHLDSSMNVEFKFNRETNYRPIAGLVAAELNAKAPAGSKGEVNGSEAKYDAKEDGDSKEDAEGDIAGSKDRHHSLFLGILADELECEVGDIQDFEISLYDTTPSCVGGMSNEFIFSPRLDNQMTCFSVIEGLCEAAEANGSDSNIHCAIVFDNEEIGSVSHHGAESNVVPSFVDRIVSLPEYSKIGYHQMLSNSFLISADMGHAINPNYTDKYETNHAPKMNAGVVIKTNANQRYTSNAQTTFLLRRVAKNAGVPVQEFEIRNDSSCGSTIGPHLSLLVRTVDIGVAQLAMHSIRETSGSADVRHYINLFKGFYEGFAAIDQALKID